MIRNADAAARSVSTEHSMRSKNPTSEKSTRLYQRHERTERQTDGPTLGDKPDTHKARLWTACKPNKITRGVLRALSFSLPFI